MPEKRAAQDLLFSWPPPACDLANTHLVDLQAWTPTPEVASAGTSPPVAVVGPAPGHDDRGSVDLMRTLPRAVRPRRAVRRGRPVAAPPWGWLAAGLLLGVLVPGPVDTAPPTRIGLASTRGLAVPTMSAAEPVPDEDAPAKEPAPRPVPPTAPAGPGAEATAPSTAPARAAPRPAPRTTDPRTRAVLGTVHAFGAAWSRLDAEGTRRVWPGADRASLRRAFTGMREQRLTLLGCTVAVADPRATARCAGTLRYRPRVGDHSTRTHRGRWEFDLQRQEAGWVITAVTSPR